MSLKRAPAVVFCLALLASPMLSGCTGMAVGAAATVGVAAYQERGVEGVARDTKLETLIGIRWAENNKDLNIQMSVEVYEGRALLTGVADSEALRADAVRLTWSVEGVKDVINEIQVDPESKLTDFAKDTWITGSLKSRIAVDRDILAINYAIETVRGVIYLIGIAQSQAELDRVIEHAKNVSYVKRVVSHVRIKRPEAAQPSTKTGAA